MPFFWGKWGFVLFHHRLFFPAHVGHHRWNQKILQVEWSSIAFTSRSPGRPGCFHLSRKHRKRLQQSKVGAVLLSLVEISNNTFGVDVMMCGPPIGLKSFYFVIKAGNMFGRFEPLKHPLNFKWLCEHTLFLHVCLHVCVLETSMNTLDTIETTIPAKVPCELWAGFFPTSHHPPWKFLAIR